MDVQTSQPSADPVSSYGGSELKRLDFLLGRWRIEGRNGEAAAPSPKCEVTGEETYEWLAGRSFLIFRWDRAFEHSAHKGLGVFGYDQSKKKHVLHSFDNLGRACTYEVQLKGRTLTLSGCGERATITVSEDGNTMREHWERLTEAAAWITSCELKGIKAGRR